MNKQQLASKIWESANKMRSKIEANEYKDYILGFIFYKFLSTKEVNYLKEHFYTDENIKQLTESNRDSVEFCQKNIGYFISYNDLFSTWIDPKSNFDISNVRDALSAFNRNIGKDYKKVFEGIFTTLETGLTKLGDTSKSQTKAVSDLLYLIKDIPMDNREDYDVLGFIYEYLISNFAANAGKKAGEFYTPHEVSKLMSDIIANYLKDREHIEIYDPTSGSGSLLINIGNSVSKYMNDPNGIKYYAQELKQNTYNLTRMNLIMRGIMPSNLFVRNGDTLATDWPYFDESDPEHTYNPLYVDAVVSNPPYSQQWEPDDRETDPRYKEYGLAPKGVADYAFLLHDLYHINSNGIMTIVLPHGVLFRGGAEGEIRKQLIEHNNIDAIIGLPANIFFGTGIPTIIMILKKNRTNSNIQIIDGSKGYIKVGKNNVLRACDIKKIVDAIINRENIDKFSKVVSLEEIRNNDYNLNIPRYVDSSEERENYDLYASMFGGIASNELEKYNEYWSLFRGLKEKLFNKVNDNYYELKVENVSETILNDADVKKYIEDNKEISNEYSKYLYNELIQNMNVINIGSEEEKISKELFDKLKNAKLIDKYKAYQELDNSWNYISQDLEVIYAEGFDSCTKVDPNMVIKKKDGKDVEMQDGWKGRIIPFELVQETFLKDLKNNIDDKNNRLEEITGSYSEIIDELSEDDKEILKDLLNDDNDAFKNSEVSKRAKVISKGKEEILTEELQQVILKVDNLITEEKKLKKEVKNDNIKLMEETKAKIESLNGNEIYDLLNKKWILPTINNIDKITQDLINDFSKSIEKISEKYLTTLNDLEKEISKTEAELSNMIDELTANEFDMKGLMKFKSLLKGDSNDKK
jgi:type I restriction enzyme M protein